MKFLYDHIDKSADNQARVKWQPNTVVLWDNRITAHVRVILISIVAVDFTFYDSQSAIVDYKNSGERRHGARITPQAERPIGPEGLDLSA